MGEDGHSHSFLTVRELLDYDWTQATTRRGQIDLDAYIKWKQSWEFTNEGRGPESYCGSASGRNMIHVGMAEVDGLMQAAAELHKGLGYHERKDAVIATVQAHYGDRTVMVKAS